MPREITITGPSSHFHRLFHNGPITLQKWDKRWQTSSGDVMLESKSDVLFAADANMDQYIFSGNKRVKVLPYKMINLSDPKDKLIIGYTYAKFKANIGILPLAVPGLDCISSVAYLFSGFWILCLESTRKT